MNELVAGRIQLFDYKRDFSSFILIEINRFLVPMNSILTRFLIRKYGKSFWSVVDISGNGEIDAYLLAGEKKSHLHVFTFAVRKEFEGRGWGKTLLAHTIDKAKDCGIATIMLEVREDNMRAIGLYKKFGFERAGIEENYYDDGTDAIIMRLKIH